ncbi:MAG: DHHA1 domain-containing protein [Vicinamibacterales bacterium]
MPATERLYYDDSSLMSFDATVVRTESRGDHVAVWLDRTAFYPTSGGQPFDTGTLGGAPVLDVEDDDAGDVVHVVSGAVPDVGATLRGDVDALRRFDHMQQHTGQHVLSAVIEHAFGARTIGFHLGTDASTIDIDRDLTPTQIARVELSANDVVWRDVPVSVRYATDDEARALPLRKESARAGTLRLVDIQGVDLSACGGTHVARTGSLGPVVVSSWERFKGGQRIEFLCGARAVRRFQQLRDMASASIRLLSVLPGQLPDAIERLQGDAREQKRALVAAQLELAKYEAAALAGGAEPQSFGRAVLRIVDGDGVRLKALASAIVARPDLLVVLISRNAPVLAVAARSSNVTVPCHELISALARQFGGKGGGKPDLAQCGGLQAQPEDVLAASRASILALTK